jgi:hypothetical protein
MQVLSSAVGVCTLFQEEHGQLLQSCTRYPLWTGKLKTDREIKDDEESQEIDPPSGPVLAQWQAIKGERNRHFASLTSASLALNYW